MIANTLPIKRDIKNSVVDVMSNKKKVAAKKLVKENTEKFVSNIKKVKKKGKHRVIAKYHVCITYFLNGLGQL